MSGSPTNERPPRTIRQVVARRWARHETVEEMSKWFRMKGYFDNGYHWCITPDGLIHRARDPQWPGCFDIKFDRDGIGVAVLGDQMTDQQVNALENLEGILREDYPDAEFINFK